MLKMSNLMYMLRRARRLETYCKLNISLRSITWPCWLCCVDEGHSSSKVPDTSCTDE